MYSRRALSRILAWAGGSAVYTASSGLSARPPQPIIGQKFTLIIDPGHGGRESGCRAEDGAFSEKHVVLRLAHALRRELGRDLPASQVLLTRTSDKTLSLPQRVRFANANQGDLFLSLHANASPRRDQTGYESYILPEGPEDQEIRLGTPGENMRPVSPNPRGVEEGEPELDPVARLMLSDLRRRERRRRSSAMALLIQKRTQSNFPNRMDRGVLEHRFGVLLDLQMPGVLHEVGFLDHKGEGALLRSPDGHRMIVRSLTDSVVDYYRKVHLA